MLIDGKEWVLVPSEPTQDMCDDATEVLIDDGRGSHTALNWSEAAAVYAAMLKAAPKATTAPIGEAGEAPRYLSDRFQWAAPGDQQEDAWIVRFCDNDVRDMLFTGPDAERDAWEAWERHAPGYNLYVFRLAALGEQGGS